MTPGSNQSRAGSERNYCTLCRQQRPRSDTRATNQRQKPISSTLKNCLTFCFKDQGRMEKREQLLDSQAEGTDGRLRELASKWFIDTQVSLIVQNGFFPAWFLGFISRKDTAEILREKELGCFLIRLSDKAIGYILSYKGKDRCRHFVINQNESGKFVVCGDNEEHDSLSSLIEYYKTRTIEPFGEYLTSPCFEVQNEELYDTIQVEPKEQSVGRGGAGKNMLKQQINSLHPPTLPLKSNRIQEEAPPLPRRSKNLDSGPTTDHSRDLYAPIRKQSPREIPSFQHVRQDSLNGDNPRRAETSTAQHIRRFSPPSRADCVYSELSMSTSVLLRDDNSDGEHPHRLSAPPPLPQRLSPKAIRQALCLENTSSCSRSSSSPSMGHINDSTLYHLTGRPQNCFPWLSENREKLHWDSVYDEVPNESISGCFPHVNTFQLIQGHEEEDKSESNTYESPEDIRPKHSLSSLGLKGDKWKWLFPDVKGKW